MGSVPGTTYTRRSRRSAEPIDRFFQKVVRQPNGCWEWTGCLANSYGRFYLPGGKPVSAHRFAFEYFVEPIPPGVTLDHQCHNQDDSCIGGPRCRHRRCVNPAHLEPVTIRINTHRSSSTLTYRRSLQTHCRNGHLYTAANTLWVQRKGKPRKQRQCRQCRHDQHQQRRIAALLAEMMERRAAL